MESENEKQYGRRPSFRKPMKVKTTEEPQVSGQEAKSEEVKSPEEILSILEAEKAGETKETQPDRREKPKTGPRPGGRPKRTGKPKSDRPPRDTRSAGRGSGPRPMRPGKTHDVKLSVVIPAFNEEGNINNLMNQFNELFSNIPYKAEMVFVDDGSTDSTQARVRQAQRQFSWLKIYSHRANKGLTEALETGFSKASGRIIIFYPADMQYHANEIPKLVSKIDSGSDVVTGWKQGKYGFKSFGSFIYNKLSRWLFKIKVHDLNSIKAFKREVMECFTYRRGWHRYIVVMASQAGYKVDEVKVKLHPRKSGKSKFGLSQLPVGFLDLLSVKFELSFTRKPLLFFGSAGIICGILGLAVGFVSLYLRFVEHAGFRPLLYAVILLIVSGLMLFAIGFLAELIVGIKEEITRKKFPG